MGSDRKGENAVGIIGKSLILGAACCVIGGACVCVGAVNGGANDAVRIYEEHGSSVERHFHNRQILKEELEDAADDLEDTIDRAADDLEDTIDRAADDLEDTFDRAADDFEDMVDRAKHQIF